ncbi:MAG TPA: MFS transporter [Porticoccaceae bacterium]|nr:MFS transporter [Porticoccaceae bacterium]HCO58610.1 MFS transporter [Porticoccaceae bacterium]
MSTSRPSREAAPAPPTENPPSQDIPLLDYRRTGYRSYVLALLTVVYAFNFIDRQILVILQEPIKAELGLSDTQLGLLTGFAFAAFYVVCGIPIAKWAEHSTRRSIIALAITIWSSMTAISGLVQNYTQLLLARIGVGVGESGGSPPAHSMLSDIYPPEKRATALSIYSTGVNIGVLIGFLLGGWINEFFGWRMAFFVVGLPGILVAIMLRFTVIEPARGMSQNITADSDAPGIGQTIKFLFSRLTFVHLALACGLQAFTGYGTGTWTPSFFIRSHEMSVGEIGTWMAFVQGGSGIVGTIIGGYVADRLGAMDKRWYCLVPCIAGLIAMPMMVSVYIIPHAEAALLMKIPPTVLYYTYIGASLAAAHALVGVRMRALTSAILMFVLNLIGMGLGPLAIGMLSDALEPHFGIESLRYSLIIFGVTAPLWAAFHFWKAGHTINQDVDNAPV